MSRLSEEEKQYLRYQIYSLRCEDPWISNKKAAKIVGHSIPTVNRYANEAERREIVPQPRIRLYPNPERRAALLLVEDKCRAYDELVDNAHVTYVCLYQGGWDILVSYEAPTDLTKITGYKEMLVEGSRGRIISPKAEYTTWTSSFSKMKDFLNQEKKREESPLGGRVCYPDWDEEEWELYYYFKNNLRRNFNKFRKKFRTSWRKYEDWKKNLRKYCSILSFFYPEGYAAYITTTFCIQTDYEKYILDLLSLLPCTSTYYRIGDHLIASIFTPRNDWSQYKILDIMSRLKDDGIVSNYSDGFAMYHWGEGEDE